MWVAFRTTARSLTDSYEVRDTRQEAETLLMMWEADPDTYCAGIAPIYAGTEPHWIEGTN